MISAEKLCAGYQGKDILKDLSFTLPEGEFTVLLGPNGAGKSTLLYTLMGFLKAHQGSVKLKGKNLTHYNRTELASIFAYIPQELHSEFEYSVEDTVLMGRFPFMGMMQKHSAEDLEILNDTLERLNLQQLRQRLLSRLSGGEKQRVYLARALVQQTPFILLDESLSQLDINYQVEIMRLLRTICTEEHKGILLISHNLNLAANYADRMIFLKEGRLLQSGTPQQLMREDILSELYNLKLMVAPNPLSKRNNIIYP
jgi:iron complex transport system ATP-binding protein